MRGPSVLSGSSVVVSVILKSSGPSNVSNVCFVLKNSEKCHPRLCFCFYNTALAQNQLKGGKGSFQFAGYSLSQREVRVETQPESMGDADQLALCGLPDLVFYTLQDHLP